MKEQIEKMAEVLRRCCDNSSKEYCNGFIDCELCEATLLYNAGYRKQSEGEWIEASNNPHVACGKKCSLCGARIRYSEFSHGNHRYCHKCGAKMKGGAE